MEESSLIISILTSMITPSVLIVACGSLSLTTSQRLNRSIDRTRRISLQLKEIRQGAMPVAQEERRMLRQQLGKATRRAMLMQRTMTLLYIAICLFIAASLLIGLFEIVRWMRPWVIIGISMAGALSLFAASILLILESRLALGAVDDEMHYWLVCEEEDNGADQPPR